MCLSTECPWFKRRCELQDELERLRALCAAEEKQLRGIAVMADSATATHLLLIADRLVAGRGEEMVVRAGHTQTACPSDWYDSTVKRGPIDGAPIDAAGRGE